MQNPKSNNLYFNSHKIKIETYAFYLMNQLENGDSLPFLSENEVIYMKKWPFDYSPRYSH